MTRLHDDFGAGAILSAEDCESAVDAWSLDELEQLADLESVRHALGRRYATGP